MGRKRIRHPGGRSWIDSDQNPVGQWSLRVDPDGLLVDSFHADGPHVHDPAHRDKRTRIGNVDLAHVERIVRKHLVANGKILLPQLVQELKNHGN